MNWGGIVLAAGASMLVASCSSDDKAAAGDPTSCGPGPYAKVTARVVEATASGTPRAKEDVVVTFAICPEKSFKSDADGIVRGNITKGLAGQFRAEHPDDVPALFGEWKTDGDFDGSISVVPKLFQSIIAPDWTPDKTLVGFGVVYPPGTPVAMPDGGPTDPCQRSEGVSIAFPEQPQAKVVYFAEAATGEFPRLDPNATKTSSNGLASIVGLPAGAVLTPVATKPGCTLTGVHDGFTGRLTPIKGFGLIFAFQMTK
jgi:hypothetical protein